MSGPIVRKYGFPNFEKIFGERPLQHGQEEADEATAARKPAGQADDDKGQAPAKDATKPGKV